MSRDLVTWQAYLVVACILKRLRLAAPFHSHCFKPRMGCVPVEVKSDGCCNLNVDLSVTASRSAWRRSAQYAQSPERGERSQNSALFHAANGFAACADMQRFVYFSRHPQLMQEHSQFPRHGDQCPLFGVLAAARG